jgi:hypothetical protein
VPLADPEPPSPAFSTYIVTKIEVNTSNPHTSQHVVNAFTSDMMWKASTTYVKLCKDHHLLMIRPESDEDFTNMDTPTIQRSNYSLA